VLGFEGATIDWSTTTGSIVSSTRCEEGSASLSISGIGYADIVSVPLASLGNVSNTISYKLLLPAEQPNPWWYGETKLQIDIPSQGIHNAFIGQRDLTGLPLDTFNTISYTLPAEIVAALRSRYTDLRFKIVLNVPQSTHHYLLDELDVGVSGPPPDGGVGTGGAGGAGPDAGAGTGGSAGAGAEPGGGAGGSAGSDSGNYTELELALKYPPGIDPSTLFFVAYDSVNVGDDAELAADIANLGSGFTRIGVGAQVEGVHSNGQVELFDQAVANGFIRTTAPVIEHGNPTIHGSVSENAPFEPLRTRTLTVRVPDARWQLCRQ